MDGLEFQAAPAAAESDPARADVACFVGYVACRHDARAQRARLDRVLRNLGWGADGPLPAAERVLPRNVVAAGDSPAAFASWLRREGWRPRENATAPGDLFRRAVSELFTAPVAEWWRANAWFAPGTGHSAADLLELADVPVPIETWDAFDTLFAWDWRRLAKERVADSTLGASVRRFFLQGGRKCYVVRVGDPWPVFERPDGATLAARLLHHLPGPTPADRSTWRGVAHLFGLPDVSLVCVPDLPEVFAIRAPRVTPVVEAETEERFIECGTRVAPPVSHPLRAFPAPRCDAAGFREWAGFVARAGQLLERHRRDVQFVAAVPLPSDTRRGTTSRADDAGTGQWTAVRTIQTAFVQLAYPWLRTRESSRLPGAVEPPDAMLAGVLANNALTSGSWRSVARQRVTGITDLEPVLSSSELERPLPYQGEAAGRRVERALRQRVSVFAPAPAGYHLLSDVTTDDDEAYRPANVNRLVAALVRAAHRAGESAVFANSGEALWRRLRSSLESLLLGLWGQGALAGGSASEAFEVRCDRSTMTQADLDAGRVVARVQFTAASPIERISVVFAMDEGSQVTLAAPPQETLEATG